MNRIFQTVDIKDPLRNENILEIQTQTLTLIIYTLGAIAYTWLVFLVWPFIGRSIPWESWAGSLILVVCTFLSYQLRNRNLIMAYWIMIGAVYASIIFAFAAYRHPVLIYLLILPILFSSVFYNPRNIIVIVLGTIVAVIGINYSFLGRDLFNSETLSQVGMMALAGMACWLSSRNLYEALEWVRVSYDQVYQNEQLMRAQQGELVRTVKALDHSTYQMERLNHFLMIERDRAEEAWRLKQRFAQNISHELRTPLSIIVGFSELMVHSPEYYGTPLPPPYLRDLTTIYRNARHLQSLTNDVLELAGIDAAQISLSLEKVDPAELARDAVNTVRSLVEKRELFLNIEISPQLPQVWLDPTRIRQVLFNLLNNAARFTDKGGITVYVSANEREVQYAVSDTGVGISPADSSRIFEEFEQVHHSGEGRGGTGLGLAISQRFVQMHGGRIWLESEPGKGSTFTFALPISGRDYIHLHKTLAGRTQQARDVERSRKTSVLLVATNNPAVTGFLSRRLTGMRIVSIQSAQNLAAALSQILPQAILVDTRWEEGSTVDWEQVTVEAELDVPLVYCALSSEKEVPSRLEVDAYLIKPVGQREIVDVMRRMGQDVHKILIVDDDRDFVQFMVRGLNNNRIRQYQLFTAYNGSEAVEMFRLHAPDLVFIDLMMPGMNGEEAVRRMQDCDPCLEERRSRFVVISGNYDTEGVRMVTGPVVVNRKGGLLPGLVVRLLNDLLGEMEEDDSARGVMPNPS